MYLLSILAGNSNEIVNVYCRVDLLGEIWRDMITLSEHNNLIILYKITKKSTGKRYVDYVTTLQGSE